MKYRYQPLYEDPEYYGEDLDWSVVETSVPDDEINTHLIEEEDVYNPHATINS